MTDKATIVFRLRHAIDRVANNPGDEWFSGAHEDLMGWIDQDLDAFEARVRAELAEEIAVKISSEGDRHDAMPFVGLTAAAVVDAYRKSAKIARSCAGSSPDTTPPLDMGFLSLPPEIQAAAEQAAAQRLDDCGVCDLVPTVSGYVRGVQVSCPVHGTTPEPPITQALGDHPGASETEPAAGCYCCLALVVPGQHCKHCHAKGYSG